MEATNNRLGHTEGKINNNLGRKEGSN